MDMNTGLLTIVFAESPLLQFHFTAPRVSGLVPESERILANRINTNAYTITTSHPYEGYPPGAFE